MTSSKLIGPGLAMLTRYFLACKFSNYTEHYGDHGYITKYRSMNFGSLSLLFHDSLHTSVQFPLLSGCASIRIPM